MPTERCGATARRALGWRAPAMMLGALVLVGALIVVVFSGVTTSTARISASTRSDGFLTAGTVVLTRTGDSARLLFDADDLYAGATVTGCVVVRYDGSVAAGLRLFATPEGGSGLDRHVRLRLVERPTATCADPDAPPSAESTAESDGRLLYDDGLRSFWQAHDAFDTGLVISPKMLAGDSVAIVATVTVNDDNRAAGLDTVLSFSFESRPT